MPDQQNQKPTLRYTLIALGIAIAVVIAIAGYKIATNINATLSDPLIQNIIDNSKAGKLIKNAEETAKKSDEIKKIQGLNIWAKNAAKTAATFNASNYKERLAIASEYFSKEGYTSYVKALEKSKLIENMIDQNMSTELIIENNFTYLAHDKDKNIILFQVPATMVYIKQNQQKKMEIKLFLKIKETLEDNKTSFTIEQFIMAPDDSK